MTKKGIETNGPRHFLTPRDESYYSLGGGVGGFFFGGGLGGTEGDESSPTKYQGGDYRKLTVGGGGKFYRDTTKFSAPPHPSPPTPDDEQ